MFLDIVAIVKINVENSITRLGLNGIKILNLVMSPDVLYQARLHSTELKSNFVRTFFVQRTFIQTD